MNKKRVLTIILFLFPEIVSSQVYLTKEEALNVYFADSSIERKTIFLTDAQVQKIQKRAKAKVESKIITYYTGNDNQGKKAYAFFETHVIRTLPATFMVVIDNDGLVRAVEILAFYEPEDYLPPERWLSLFHNKKIDGDLWLKRGIHNIVGATLSAQAITESIRKILATYEIVIVRGNE